MVIVGFAFGGGLPTVSPPLKLSIVSGNGQIVPRSPGDGVPGGRAYFDPLSVKLTNADGTPAANIKVGFKASGTGGLTPQIAVSPGDFWSTTTDGNGMAVLNYIGGHSVRAMYADGAFTVNVSADDALPAAATFNLTVGNPPPKANPTITIVSGNGQSLPRKQRYDGNNSAQFAPMVVLLKDAAGKPIAGEAVMFSSPSPNAAKVQLEPASAQVITGSDGTASFQTIGKAADGAFAITVTYGNASAVISGNIANTVTPPLKISIVSGNGQIVPRSQGDGVPGGRAYFDPLSVKLTNANGTPAANIKVGFKAYGSGSLTPQIAVSPGDFWSTTTDGNGMAVLNYISGHSVRAMYAEGPFTVNASADDASPAAVTFNLTVGNPPPKPVAPTLKVLPNGMRVRDPASGAIYLVLDGKLRWVPNPETYNNLFKDWTSVTQITTAAEYLVGQPLTDGAYLAGGSPDGKIFLVVDATKRWITSPQVFDLYGFNWGIVRQLTVAQLKAISDGPNI